MKNLTKNNERITVMKLVNTDVAAYDLFKVIRAEVAVGDLTLRYDYAIGDRFVADFAGFSFGHLQKFNPLLLAKVIKNFQVG